MSGTIRGYIDGRVVDKEQSEPWKFNGREGITYTLFVKQRESGERYGADRVTCSREQFEAAEVGQDYLLPIVAGAYDVNDRNGVLIGSKLSVSVKRDHVLESSGAHVRAV